MVWRMVQRRPMSWPALLPRRRAVGGSLVALIGPVRRCPWLGGPAVAGVAGSGSFVTPRLMRSGGTAMARFRLRPAVVVGERPMAQWHPMFRRGRPGSAGTVVGGPPAPRRANAPCERAVRTRRANTSCERVV